MCQHPSTHAVYESEKTRTSSQRRSQKQGLDTQRVESVKPRQISLIFTCCGALKDTVGAREESAPREELCHDAADGPDVDCNNHRFFKTVYCIKNNLHNDTATVNIIYKFKHSLKYFTFSTCKIKRAVSQSNNHLLCGSSAVTKFVQTKT